MLIRSHAKGFVALALLCAISGRATAQSNPKPYTLDDVIAFVQNDVPAARVVTMAKNACINFKVSDSVAERLRNAGANDSLIDGLRSACYKGASSKDVETPTRRVNPPAPRVVVKHDTVVVPRERVVVKHDTVVIQRPVVPPPVVTPAVVTPATSTNSLDWDFRSSQPLSAGRFGKCQYDYSSAGYTISIAENGSPCLDGAPNEWDSNVRISTSATPVSGAAGYNYGIRFGVSDDSTVGYWAFEVSTLGHYQLSRFRNHAWEVVFPWKTGTGINTTTTNNLAVEIRGSSLTFIINGIQQTTWQAPSPVRGRAGFGVFGYGDDPPFPVVTFASFGVASFSPPPTTTTTTTSNYVDWDFRSVQPLTSGRFGTCQYDYSSAGYTISVAENGTTCIDGPLGDQPASVRISTTALPIHGTPGYTYGIRFGYTTDSTVGYYAFEISEGGSFQLSRYRMKVWEPLIPWQRLAGTINPASANTNNVMTVDIRGTSLTLFVNGTQVGTYQTPYPAVGPAGFGLIGYSNGSPLPMVTFTRFSISPL
jgi:hypothetical protein